MGSYGNKYLVSKKVAAALFLFFVVWSVALALVVYYAGVTPNNTEQVEKEQALSSAQVKKTEKKVTDVRLPLHLVPEQYNLKLIPFIKQDNFTIDGYVEISMLCMHEGANITLHSKDTEIQNKTVKVEDNQGNNVGISRYSYDHGREFFILHLTKNLEKGTRYTVKITFTAFLRDNLKGFYRSEYDDKESGKKELMAVTQFQPTEARRAFPCFDEPGVKAKFEVSLGRKKEYSSISNMPIREKGVAMERDEEYVWDHFQNSVKMSTYLVAFVISKFEYRESEQSDSGVWKFRIWTRKDALSQTEYARSIGPKMLKFFEDYFQVPFPLPKQDMIAAPDFAAGAMENWGLITYRETALLYKPGVSAASNTQRIAYVVSHELAHQWFGNLVTPSWWSDLWLNEGFASYVQYLGVEAVQPQLNYLDQFVLDEVHKTLRLDALESSHPISIQVKHPDEINEIFDTISYSKGASVIRMMDHFLTSNTFKKGLTNYLRALKFDSAEQDDLWMYLTEQGHRDRTLMADLTVKQVMDTWTLQTGFPLLTVKRNYESGTAKISQERLLLSKSTKSESRWWVPLTYTTPGLGNFNDTYNKDWLSDKQWSKQLDDMPDRNTPVIFNVQQTGFYRVNYDKKNWELIAETLNKDHTSIHVINRAQILDDALELAKVGRLDYKTALSLTGYLSRETEFVPWYAALGGLTHIKQMLKRTSAYGEFKGYMLKLLAPIYQKLGFEGKSDDKHLEILLRKRIVSWACSMGHEDCKNKVKTSFNNWMFMPDPDAELKNPIDVNMKGVTYCNAIAEGGQKEWDFAWERYKNSNVGTEKANILSALSCTDEVWMLNRYLNMSLTAGSGVRKQDGSSVIANVARNTVGRYLAFNFLREKFDVVKNYFTSFSSLKRIVKAMSGSFNTNFDLKELKDFQATHEGELGTSTRAVEQAIESGLANVDWMQTNYENVWSWLKTYNLENKRG